MNKNAKKEEQLTLELLEAINRDSGVSQRTLARQMGVALGLANLYLKRCIKKGLVKIKDAPANRYFYYVTPKGFSEKARLTARYLSYSFSYYREASESCERIMKKCNQRKWNRIMLCGASDLAEIASIRAAESGIDIVGVYDPKCTQNKHVQVPVYRVLPDEYGDACIITEYEDPITMMDEIGGQVSKERVLVPDLLRLNV